MVYTIKILHKKNLSSHHHRLPFKLELHYFCKNLKSGLYFKGNKDFGIWFDKFNKGKQENIYKIYYVKTTVLLTL